MFRVQAAFGSAMRPWRRSRQIQSARSTISNPAWAERTWCGIVGGIARPDLIIQLFAELRETALGQAGIGDALNDCCLAVPLQFDTRQTESLQEAARSAGFPEVCTVDAPVAAIRHHDRLGRSKRIMRSFAIWGTARIAVLERGDSILAGRPGASTPSRMGAGIDPSKAVMDALEHIISRLAERDVVNPPLLLVGGNARGDGIHDAFQREGWKGEVIIAENPEFSIALGAIDVWRICPECGCDQVPIFGVVCVRVADVRVVPNAERLPKAILRVAGTAGTRFKTGLIARHRDKFTFRTSLLLTPPYGPPNRRFPETGSQVKGCVS